MTSLDAVYVNYWSLRDPLCQSQSLPVVTALAAAGWRMGLVTFEQAPWAVPRAEQAGVVRELAARGVSWSPLRYHKRPPVISTAWDVARGALRCAWWARRAGARLLHGRATVAAAIARVASSLAGTRFLDDADGPLSEEYVEAGIWGRGSVPHRLTRWAEERCLATADRVAVLTRLRQEEVAPLAREPAVVLPCGVDLTHFRFDEAGRVRLRQDLSVGDGQLLVYSGKWGGWYRGDTVVDFAAAARRLLGDVRLLVLTAEDPRPFLEAAAGHGLPCVVRRASRDEMPASLSAADAGLSFRLDTPSQRACSPIKNGEYLACGLPVVTTRGAGDYSGLLAREGVGVVLEGTDAPALEAGARALAALLEDPGRRQHCRDVARREVGLAEVVVPRYLELYRELLGSPERRA